MSFSQQALDLNEAFAFLDDFDLVTPARYENRNTYSTTTTATNSSSNSSSPSVSSGHESFTDSDDALLSLLNEDTSGPFSFEPGVAWDVGRHSLQNVYQDELSSPSMPTQQQKPQSSTRKKKTKAATASPFMKTTAAAAASIVAVKRPRKHNRVEILKLREQLEELQVQHSSLQLTQKRQRSIAVASSGFGDELITAKALHSSDPVAAGRGAPRSLWFEHAADQYKKRQQSESLNRRLRAAVAQQLKVTNLMQATLHKRVPAQELNFLLQKPTANDDGTCGQLLRTLHASIESQYQEIDSMLHKISLQGDATSPFTICQTKQDAVRGPTFEITNSVPIANDFQVVGQAMWNRTVNSKNPAVVHSLSELEHSQNHFLRHVYEKKVEMTAPSKFGELRIDGVLALCKSEEDRRVVMLMAAAFTVCDTDIIVHQHAWMAVSKVTKNPEQVGIEAQPVPDAAVFQALFSISSEKTEGNNSSLDDAAHFDEKTRLVQSITVEVLGDHMRVHMAELQSSLLLEVGDLATNLREFKCPVLGCPC